MVTETVINFFSFRVTRCRN